MQLEACLRSLHRHCLDLDAHRVYVLYAASTPAIDRLYDRLAPDFGGVAWHRQTVFSEDLRQLLGTAESIVFVVDDAVFVRRWRVADCAEALRDEKVLGVSLRLGRNTQRCYSLEQAQEVPALHPIAGELLGYAWRDKSYDFGYPLEVSSSVYRSADLLDVLRRSEVDVRNPNLLEVALDGAKHDFDEARPVLACYPQSVAFCIPLNIVQSEAANRALADPDYSWHMLLRAFEAGYRLDVDSLDGYVPDACHAEMLPRFLPPAESDAAIRAVLEVGTQSGGRFALAGEAQTDQFRLDGVDPSAARHLRIALRHAKSVRSGDWLQQMVRGLFELQHNLHHDLAQALSAARDRNAQQWSNIEHHLRPALQEAGAMIEGQEERARQLRASIVALQSLNDQMAQALSSESSVSEGLRATLIDVRSQLAAANAAADERTLAVKWLQDEVLALRSSTSWRVTRPFRFMSKVARAGRRGPAEWRRIAGRMVHRAAERSPESLPGRMAARWIGHGAGSSPIHPTRHELAEFEAQNLERLLGLWGVSSSGNRSPALPDLPPGGIGWRRYLAERRSLLDEVVAEGSSARCDDPRVATLAAADCARIVAQIGSPATISPIGEVIQQQVRIWVDHHLAHRLPETASLEDRSVPATFSLLTPFYRHLVFFERCAASVELLRQRSPQSLLEWIVVNDDPHQDEAALLSRIPQSLRDRVVILSDGRNLGIVRRLNEGITRSRGQWILFLDCDDLILPNAIQVLEQHLSRRPDVRYVSSAMLDIDEHGHVLRFRPRSGGSESLLTEGMTAGHLKAIHRSAFTEAGLLLEGAEGCQDYEFALRMLAREPLLFIPEYLYAYRWHGQSQSVSQAHRQSWTTQVLLQRFLLGDRLDAPGFLLPHDGGGLPPVASPEIAVIVRTTGKRPDLLRQTVESVGWSTVPARVIVVVHGDRSVRGLVLDGLQGVEARFEVIVAHEPDRRRGHPLNVGLDHLQQSDERPFAVAFLDDDDIFYPLFGPKAVEGLRVSGADVLFFGSNRRVPWEPALKGYGPGSVPALLAGNYVPINGYLLRFSTIGERGLRFDESLEYLEDWDFLVTLMAQRVSFHSIDDVLCEFRITGDGNTAVKRQPELWRECAQRVMRRARDIIAEQGPAWLSSRLALTPPDMVDDSTAIALLNELRQQMLVSVRAMSS